MDKAMNSKKEYFYANDAKYSIYFCIECGSPAYLRKPSDREAHFYHFRINKNCSLSHTNDSVKVKSNDIINKSIEIIKHNTSLLNWIWAFDNLLKYDCIDLLNEFEWAVNPLKVYLDNKESILNYNDLLKCYMVIFSNKNNRFKMLLIDLLGKSNRIAYSDRLQLLEVIIKNTDIIDDDIIKKLHNYKYKMDELYFIYSKLDYEQRLIVAANDSFKVIEIIFNLLNMKSIKLMKSYYRNHIYLKHKKMNIDLKLFYSTTIKVLSGMNTYDSLSMIKYMRREAINYRESEHSKEIFREDHNEKIFSLKISEYITKKS